MGGSHLQRNEHVQKRELDEDIKANMEKEGKYI